MSMLFRLSLLMLLVWGCKSPLERGVEQILTDRDGYFRGFSPGDSYEAVLNNEDESFRIYMDSVALQYKIPLSDSEYCQVNYVFENMQLREIHALIFIGASDEGDQLFRLFSLHFEKIMGKPGESHGVTVFKDAQGVSVELYQESDLYEASVVRIWIYSAEPASEVPEMQS